MSAIKRNLEANALEMLEMFPVVAILGARQVGKTTLGSIHFCHLSQIIVEAKAKNPI